MDARGVELDLDGDGAGSGGRLGWALDAGNSGEEGREVAPNDLRRRPPKGIGAGRRGVAGAAGDVVPEVARLPPGQEQPSEHRPERLRRQIRAGVCRDHLGGGVRLLGSDAALLDREAGDVAGGEDVGETVDLAVRVDGEETLDRLWQAIDTRPPQAWERDDAVGRDRSLGDEAQLPVNQLDRARARPNGDSPLFQQTPAPPRFRRARTAGAARPRA